MEKIILPAIVQEAKAKPLSYDPRTRDLIYYDKVANGQQKIYPLASLDKASKKKLSTERYKASETDMLISTLNGENYSKKDIINEIEKETPIGENFLKLDIDYLALYLSSFPKNAFIQ